MNRLIIGLLGLIILNVACKSSVDIENLRFSETIPCVGNSWVVNEPGLSKKIVGKDGIQNWTSPEAKIRTYFKTEKAGTVHLGLIAKTTGPAKIKIALNEQTEVIQINNTTFDTIRVQAFEINEPGYHFIEMQGMEKEGEYFPEIQAVLIGGEASQGKVWYAKEDFYWGRRGPSVHLGFQVPEEAGDVVYFYNEITVPKGNDVLGSYFMANGFGQGYFGIQVNSPTERRVLFSVWSPYNTDDPNEIPEDQRINLIKKGEDVYTGKFGNEGSGGQSYWKFMWKAETTYRFLLKGKPAGNNKTDFTAWFFAPELNEWKLIASFRRPKTDTYLTRLYSFLENFYTEQGNVSRKGYFTNQWAYTSNKQWLELTKIKFTADATARKESRMDYAGGVENGKFFLKNCGFFSETTPIDSYFEREAGGVKPEIDFDALP